MDATWIVGWIVTGSCLFGSLLWLGQFVRYGRARHLAVYLEHLPDGPAPRADGSWPTLSILFAGRNEEASVEAATRSMLAQDYPGVTVVAVDDRSTDATGAILDRLAAEDPLLRVVHVRELPPGWLGKNNALQMASETVDTDYLLFTDADVVLAPGTLRRAVVRAEAEGLSHITLSPDVTTLTFGEKLFMSLFGLLFSFKSPLPAVGNPNRREYIGVGAFNLVRTESFRAVGGFKRLSLSIDDDMRLGQILKYAGYRMQMLLGRNLAKVRWQIGFWGMIRGLEKNFFAGLEFRLRMVLWGTFVMLCLGWGPFVGSFVGPVWSRVVCGLAVVAILVMCWGASKQSRIPIWFGFLFPFSSLVMIFSMWRSTWKTLRQGGVRWRDHLYPLAELRQHVAIRDAWIEELWKSTH